MHGYHGKVLHVDLGSRSCRVDEPDEIFYRLYAGGGLLATHFLLKETHPGIDPLGPDNLLIFNREGLTPADDWLPDRFFDDPIDSGAKQGTRLDRAAFRRAIQAYYEMMGWDERGAPRPATLYDHHLEWVLGEGG